MEYIGTRDDLNGRVVRLEPEDLRLVLASDGLKGVVRDKEPWNNITFSSWDDDGSYMVHIHEWEDDDDETDYEAEDAPAGMIYYEIYRFDGAEWFEEDGGVIGYELGDTLGDWLEDTLGITESDLN